MSDDGVRIVQAEVTLHVKVDEPTIVALKAMAHECDRINGNEEQDYTLAQAIQVVWQTEPDWLHANALLGWTMDRTNADDPDEGLQPVWPSAY